MGYWLWAMGDGRGSIAALVALAELEWRGGGEERTVNRGDSRDISGPPLRAEQVAAEDEERGRSRSELQDAASAYGE